MLETPHKLRGALASVRRPKAHRCNGSDSGEWVDIFKLVDHHRPSCFATNSEFFSICQGTGSLDSSFVFMQIQADQHILGETASRQRNIVHHCKSYQIISVYFQNLNTMFMFLLISIVCSLINVNLPCQLPGTPTILQWGELLQHDLPLKALVTVDCAEFMFGRPGCMTWVRTLGLEVVGKIQFDKQKWIIEKWLRYIDVDWWYWIDSDTNPVFVTGCKPVATSVEHGQ